MTLAPPSWYPDPENASQLRWWNGAEWTPDRAPYPQLPVVGYPAQAAAPYGAQAAPYSPDQAALPLTAPEGTPWNTVWIWIIVFLPYLPSLGLLGVDWSTLIYVNNPNPFSALSFFFSPGYLIATIGGFISLGLIAWFSYLDWKELIRRGVPKPFHWAFGFLSVVYPIGRSVIVRRRTGHGISPMWATISAYVLYLILIFTYLAVTISTMMTSIFSQVGLYA